MVRMTRSSSGSSLHQSEPRPARRYDRAAFARAYEKVILGNEFVELDAYYRQNRTRYENTLRHVVDIPLARPARILEIGGGQIALLCRELFGDSGTLADVSGEYAEAVIASGLEFVECDLLRGDIEARDHFDLIVLCEVIEHIPVPPHLIFEKMTRWMKPGGYMLVTTPNLYRLRNLIRLASGGHLFCNFYYPKPGSSLGHPLEYSADAIGWQLERAGLALEYIRLEQLVNVGSSLRANIARKLCAPLLALRPLWRDNLVALARKPLGWRPAGEGDDSRASPGEWQSVPQHGFA